MPSPKLHAPGELDFVPSLKEVGTVDPHASIEQIASEPRLVGASYEEAWAHGGPLARRVLGAIGAFDCPGSLFPIVDTRCQRLMPGMYSAIPGWHCDDWPRPGYGLQPEPSRVDERARHFTASIDSWNGELCPTEFVSEPVHLALTGESLWRSVHRGIEALKPSTETLGPGSVLRFGSHTIHRATPARVRGWRFWFRLSFMHTKPEKALTVGPEQVYVLSEENGW